MPLFFIFIFFSRIYLLPQVHLRPRLTSCATYLRETINLLRQTPTYPHSRQTIVHQMRYTTTTTQRKTKTKKTRYFCQCQARIPIYRINFCQKNIQQKIGWVGSTMCFFQMYRKVIFFVVFLRSKKKNVIHVISFGFFFVFFIYYATATAKIYVRYAYDRFRYWFDKTLIIVLSTGVDRARQILVRASRNRSVGKW